MLNPNKQQQQQNKQFILFLQKSVILLHSDNESLDFSVIVWFLCPSQSDDRTS